MKIFSCLLKIIFINLLFKVSAHAQVCNREKQDTVALSAFPLKVRGEYVNLDDHSELLITGKAMYRIYDIRYPIHADQLNNIIIRKKDVLINSITNENIPYIVRGDSLIIHFHDVDTVFEISKYHVLKKFHHDYFLFISNEWGLQEIRKMNYSGKLLTITVIYRKEPFNLDEPYACYLPDYFTTGSRGTIYAGSRLLIEECGEMESYKKN